MEDEFGIDKKAKRILFIAMLIICVPLIIFMYWKITHSIGGKDLLIQDAKSESFYGMVDSIYRDTRNHDIEMLELSGGYEYPMYREWEPRVKIGDSLAKDYGSLKVKIYKKGGRTDTLDYKKLIATFR